VGLPAHPLLDPALDALDAIWAEWDAAGRPATTTGSVGQRIVHPLLVALERQERFVAERLPRATVGDVGNVPVWPSHRPLPGGHEPGAVANVVELGRSRRKTA
jgi:hypothetical protein